ncbi:MAG: hypothetical protein ACRYFL_14235 [Janthinobacterium lividum]
MLTSQTTTNKIGNYFFNSFETVLVQPEYSIFSTTPVIINNKGNNTASPSQKVKQYFENKKWDLLKNKFAKHKENGLFAKTNMHSIQTKIDKILKSVFAIYPSAVSVQLTNDESILVSFIVDKITTYLECFTENHIYKLNEYIINSYIDNKIVIDSYSSDFDMAFYKIKQLISENEKYIEQEEYKLEKLIQLGFVLEELQDISVPSEQLIIV